MKIRKGFVSNSSSTSFVCDVCAESVGGWDMGLEEADMFTCENSHTFCRDHTVGGREILEKQMEEDEEIDSYEVPAKYCPCCTFHNVADVDIVSLYMKENNVSRDDVAKIFNKKFKDYDEFLKYVNSQ